MKTESQDFRSEDSAILAEINAQHTPATWDAAAHNDAVDTADFLAAKLAAAYAVTPLTVDEIRSLPHRASSDLSDMPSALVALTGEDRQIDDGTSRYFVPIRVGVITAALTADHIAVVAAIVAARARGEAVTPAAAVSDITAEIAATPAAFRKYCGKIYRASDMVLTPGRFCDETTALSTPVASIDNVDTAGIPDVDLA